jgi:asparagine synthase (glutamine-hydrolysing)
MSGVCGICAPGREFESSLLEPMLSALALAGETGRDTTSANSVALGVARRWESQEVAAIPGVRIAIDADLYNVDELKSKLAARGLESREWTVAQCLAHLYVIHGPDFLERLHGIFSLALWDERARRLLLAIDRLGAKSLYWSHENDRLLFGSRLGSIRAAREIPLEINPSSLSQYLIFSVIPHPLTVYKGVQKLPPGTRLIFENGAVRQDQYWNLEYLESGNHSISYWANQVQEAMRSSVHSHLSGCDPKKIGAYLSGGTDSSSVVAFMHERHAPVNTFSIFFQEAEYSEAHFARTTANHFHTRHREKEISPQEAFKAIQKIVRYYDEPFANSSAFGAYYCAAIAREAGVDTLLAGDGGDELFAGNSRYADDKKFAFYHSVPKWIRQHVVEPASRLLPQNDGLLSLPGKYLLRARIPNPRRIFSYNFFVSTNPEEVFEPGFLAETHPDTWMDIAAGHFHSARATSELNRLLYLDVKLILADNDIRKVTGTAELCGVRVRYPLLDFRLAELSAQIPSELKLNGFQKRFVFKKAMQNVLPREVLYKKKHGFGVPLARWLLRDRQLSELVQDVLRDKQTRQRGYFQPAFYDRILCLHREEHVEFYGEVVWYLLALELWHRQHFDTVPGVFGA